MASIIDGYQYDIFISYRQNDNKRDKWVTEFVDTLKDELEATLKNPVSIYFDENPHDGLLETHDVDRSLEKKLKCLVFIPIISQTYCDPKCFAWEHELLPFIELTNKDELGMNITLANGNVASRILPIRIHDVDAEDTSLFESVIDGRLRPIDFVYKTKGVNRPLKPVIDDVNTNEYHTVYRDQINKVANSLKEIGISILRQTQGKVRVDKTIPELPLPNRSLNRGIFIGLAAFILLILMYWGYSHIYNSKEVVVEDITIAVLPFSNTNPNTDTDYLGFAIADQIIGDLVYLKNITVRPSGSIRKYEKQATDPIIVGDELKVDYVLIGNYLKQANIIRLNVELINVNSNEMIWREPIEVDYHDAFQLQDIVAQKVVEGLDIQFSQHELDIIKKDIPADPLAYEYYLRSISYPLSIEGDHLAIEMLNKSIELDSNFAPAYAELGRRIRALAQFSMQESESEIKRAENYYLKALSLNEELLTALGNLAMLYTEIAKSEKAVELTRKMLEINPNNAEAHFSLGYSYRYAGMLNESIQEMEKAVSIDPRNPRFRSLGITYLNVGEFEKAFDALDIDKGSIYAIGWQGTILFREGNHEQGIKYFDRVISMEPEGLWGLYATVIKAIINGNTKIGLDATHKLEEANFADAETWYYTTVGLYALLGDRDGCIRCLRRAVDGGFFNYPFMLTDSFLDSVRDDPEFQEIMEDAKEKHLAFKEQYFK